MTATDNGKWGSAPPTDKVVVRCQTCQQTQEWDDGTDGMAWAIQHSRETGHPDQYRVLTPDFPAGELAQLREKVDPDVEATLARLEQHVTDLEAQLARTHADCYTPIPLRWRHVRPGDVVVLKDKLWAVTAANPDLTEQQIEITVVRGAKLHEARLDADATVPVLVRHQEREALQIAREQLGATVVDRRV